MSGVNKVILVGRVGKDVEMRNLENGSRVANFSLATSEKYKDKTTGNAKEVTEWHEIVLWNALADTASKYLSKGNQVYIEGKLRTRSWEKDGVARYKTEIICENMILLGGKKNSATPESVSNAEVNDLPGTEESFSSNLGNAADDLPF